MFIIPKHRKEKGERGGPIARADRRSGMDLSQLSHKKEKKEGRATP